METTQPRNFLESLKNWQPIVQWILTILIGAMVLGLSFRDSQNSQAAQILKLENKQQALSDELREQKDAVAKQYQELRNEVATKVQLQDKFETLIKLQELMREDLKQMREQQARASPP